VAIRLSPRELQVVMTAARVNHQTIAGFIRESIWIAAGDCLEDVELSANAKKRP